MFLQDNMIILFQGDSITDANRIRDISLHLGDGYVRIIANWITALYPNLTINFLNRGLSGNRSIDLVSRWDEDCIQLKPDIVSIMIGINDVWRRFDKDLPTTGSQFEANYREILDNSMSKLNAKIVLCEPFLLPDPPDRQTWQDDLDEKLDIVRRLAHEYSATLVPLYQAFTHAAEVSRYSKWTIDGIHPTQAGHALITQQWLKAMFVRV